MLLLATALTLEALLGYPERLYRAIRHPVVWMGALIARLDRALPRSRPAGALALLALLAATWLPASIATLLLTPLGWPGLVALAALASTGLASRSLHTHVAAVEAGLRQGLPQGREAVSHIVGRDPASLDEPAIARAAIESLAENFADGVVAPALWCALLGLPGIMLYKAVNTADSMVGHRTPRHERYGWASARLDDLVNLPASRLAALWLVLAAAITPGASPRAALRATLRDAPRHRSPNAGWPEAAMAGALRLRLAGPRTYAGVRVDDAWMGDGTPDAGPADIARALRLYRTACALQLALAWAAAMTLGR